MFVSLKLSWMLESWESWQRGPWARELRQQQGKAPRTVGKAPRTAGKAPRTAGKALALSRALRGGCPAIIMSCTKTDQRCREGPAMLPLPCNGEAGGQENANQHKDNLQQPRHHRSIYLRHRRLTARGLPPESAHRWLPWKTSYQRQSPHLNRAWRRNSVGKSHECLHRARIGREDPVKPHFDPKCH